MRDLESTVLDGRYQVLRQIGGTDQRPLVVASDLQRGGVVCLRQWPFNSALVGPAALPALAPLALAGDDGPLLPHDFGVDGGIAYTVRPHQTTTSLAARLRADPAVEPVEAVRLIRGAAQALLTAREHGFGHGHVRAEHILLAPGGRLYVCGFDQPDNHYSVAREQHDVRALLALLGELLAISWDSQQAEEGRACGDGRRREPVAPPALRDLLIDLDRWLASGGPPLAHLLRALQRAERRLAGVRPLRGGATAAGRAVVAVGRRLRHLGPLLQPYLLALALLTVTVLFLAGAFGGSPAEARRLLIYAVAPTAMPAVESTPAPAPSVPTTSPLPAFVPPRSASETEPVAPPRPAETEASGANPPIVPTATVRWDAPGGAPASPDLRAATELVAPSPTTVRAYENRARPTATPRRADTPAGTKPAREPTAGPSPSAVSSTPQSTAGPRATSAHPTATSTPTPRPAAHLTVIPASATTRAARSTSTATPLRRS